ncbi:MAG: hypothetical protein H6739_27510 [Alphaproteobacteria bacterium]|nr:hypothetical protein [Alphaproteobacteria bacterium]
MLVWMLLSCVQGGTWPWLPRVTEPADDSSIADDSSVVDDSSVTDDSSTPRDLVLYDDTVRHPGGGEYVEIAFRTGSAQAWTNIHFETENQQPYGHLRLDRAGGCELDTPGYGAMVNGVNDAWLVLDADTPYTLFVLNGTGIDVPLDVLVQVIQPAEPPDYLPSQLACRHGYPDACFCEEPICNCEVTP